MKFLPLAFLHVAAATVAEAQAPEDPIFIDISCYDDTYSKVRNKLINVFEEKNCVELSSGDAHPDGYPIPDNNALLSCEVNFPDYRAYAQYMFFLTPSGGRINLDLKTVTADLDENGEETDSYMSSVTFNREGSCLKDANLDLIQNHIFQRACISVEGPFVYKGKQDITCDELGEKKLSEQTKLCEKYDVIAKSCPVICRSSKYCTCIDNENPFPLGGDKTLTCDKVDSLSENKKWKKCLKKKVKDNCPGVCEVGVCNGVVKNWWSC